MKNTLFILCFLFTIGFTKAQFIQSRLLKVEPSNVEAFQEAARKKTKMYNSKAGQIPYLTFQILTGKNAQHYVRMRYSQTAADLDLADPKGDAYWLKTTGDLHTSEGGRLWSRVANATYVPENSSNDNHHRRVIYYNVSEAGMDDFWSFRAKVKKAMEASGYGQRMGVMNCISGCDGNWVQVRFHHKNFAGEASDYDAPLTSLIEKYNELYGENAYEQDSKRMAKGLVPDGRRIRHYKYMPEMSSPWSIIQN